MRVLLYINHYHRGTSSGEKICSATDCAIGNGTCVHRNSMGSRQSSRDQDENWYGNGQEREQKTSLLQYSTPDICIC